MVTRCLRIKNAHLIIKTVIVCGLFNFGVAFLGAQSVEPEKPKNAAGTRETFVLGSIGDSLSSGFNSDHPFLNNKHVSWGSGTDVKKSRSHYLKLVARFPDKTVLSYNYSIPGTKSQYLNFMAQWVNRNNPDYVTITMGANDICKSKVGEPFNISRFEAQMDEALRTLIAHNKDVKIFLSLIPNILFVRQLGINDNYCHFLWANLIHSCRAALSPDLTPPQLDEFNEKWHAANRVLESFAQKYPENIKVPPIELADTKFTVEQVTRHDCFHPTILGQNSLSDETWKYSWFAGKSEAEFNTPGL